MPNYALPLSINSFSRYSVGTGLREFEAISGTAAVTWVANTAVYIPFSIPWPYPVKRVFWINGSTITTSNVDFGIYTIGGKRIYSTGSTAMSGASTLQYVSVSTPFILTPGAYFMAWNCDNTTNRAYGSAIATAANGALLGMLSQAVGAIALPASATFATFGAPGLQFCGFTRKASGF